MEAEDRFEHRTVLGLLGVECVSRLDWWEWRLVIGCTGLWERARQR